MGLVADGKVIIEVGLNEWASKAQNPNIPYGIDEVIADGVACAEAGAAVLHFHARDDQGDQLWSDAGVYGAEMAAIADRADVLTYPSYNGTMEHFWELLDTLPENARPFVLPFDVYQGVGLTRWDPEAKSFTEVVYAVDALNAKRKGDRPADLDELVRRGMAPTICIQELGELRWVGHALDAGILRAPVTVKLFLKDRLVKGAEATPRGIDALLTHVTDGMEPGIVPSGMRSRERTEAVLRHAIRRGVHIRVGLGDNPDAFPTGTNADLVRWAVQIIREEGKEPATPDDIRAYFAPAVAAAAATSA